MVYISMVHAATVYQLSVLRLTSSARAQKNRRDADGISRARPFAIGRASTPNQRRMRTSVRAPLDSMDAQERLNLSLIHI